MILRHLEFLTALAREKHFSRAAQSCNVTQSTLSAGLKQMEESLGSLLVERGQRFVGLTPEGELALVWAQRVLADYDALIQNLAEMRDGLHGYLKIGAVPATLPILSALTTAFAHLHPKIQTVIRSLSSIEIQRGIDDHSLDLGVTYLENEPVARVRRLRLYAERYYFVSFEPQGSNKQKSISWREAASRPLCLLTGDMQNRRILDAQFKKANVQVHAAIEANSLITLWSHLKLGQWSTIVPNSFLSLIGNSDGLVALPLSEPEIEHAVGLVATDRDPLPPATRAFFDLAKQPAMHKKLDHLLLSYRN